MSSLFYFDFGPDVEHVYAPNFERFLAKIDPHILSDGDKAYIISDNMKQIDCVTCSRDLDSGKIFLDTGHIYWELYDGHDKVYTESNPNGDSVYAMIGDPKTDPIIYDDETRSTVLNSIYVKSDVMQLSISVRKSHDIKIGDLFMDDWTNSSSYIYNVEYEADRIIIHTEMDNNHDTIFISHDTYIDLARVHSLGG